VVCFSELGQENLLLSFSLSQIKGRLRRKCFFIQTL
jgi:hypothetical protein